MFLFHKCYYSLNNNNNKGFHSTAYILWFFFKVWCNAVSVTWDQYFVIKGAHLANMASAGGCLHSSSGALGDHTRLLWVIPTEWSLRPVRDARQRGQLTHSAFMMMGRGGVSAAAFSERRCHECFPGLPGTEPTLVCLSALYYRGGSLWAWRCQLWKRYERLFYWECAFALIYCRLNISRCASHTWTRTRKTFFFFPEGGRSSAERGWFTQWDCHFLVSSCFCRQSV